MRPHHHLRYVPYVEHRNFGCRLREFVYRGLKCVSLENRYVRVSVAVDKGADIYELLHKATDTELLLRTPLGLRSHGPVPPSVDLREGSFLDYYEGGWQELFPCAGDHVCDYKGAQIGMHGEVALLPWSYRIDEDSPQKIAVTFLVSTLRTPFHLRRTMVMEEGTGAITIEETITNHGDEAMQFMWGHHPAFGWPFLEEGCEISLPACSVIVPARELLPNSRFVAQESAWPFVRGTEGQPVNLSVMPSPETRAHDMAFLHGFREGWYEIKNPRSGIKFRLSWNPSTFPYLWFWQATRGAFGYPWYGQTYSLALEPHSSYPPQLPEAIERGTSLELQAGAKLSTKLIAEVS